MVRLSVLDQSTVVSGRSPDTSIRESIALARHCEALGYARYWCAEHHNSDSQAGTAPEILIAAIAATTKRIRVGSAGVMLPHYSALKVAEQFRVLDAIAPGRIDLGLGRAPGSDGRTAFALNPRADDRGGAFPAAVRDLLAWVSGEPWWRATRSAISAPSPPGRRCRRCGFSAVPITARRSRRISGCRTASPISSPTGTARSRLWRCIATATGPARGIRSRMPRSASGRWRRTRRRKPPGCSSRARCGASAATAASTPPCPRRRKPRRIHTPMWRTRASSACGSAPYTARRRRRRASAGAGGEHQVEEIAILTTLHDPAVRRRSYALLAQEFGLRAPDVLLAGAD